MGWSSVAGSALSNRLVGSDLYLLCRWRSVIHFSLLAACDVAVLASGDRSMVFGGVCPIFLLGVLLDSCFGGLGFFF